MASKRKVPNLTVQFDDAESHRLRLIELEHFAKLDFPCSVLLVDPAAVGAATEMSTIPKAKLIHWLKLFDEGYFYSLSKAAGAVRGDENSAYDRLPTLDEYLRRHDANDGRLLAFAERLLTLSDEERGKCAVGVYGAPDDSEDSGFAPRRRTLVRDAGSAAADASKCDSPTHAFVIRSALMALGPTAAVKNAPNDDPAEREFRLCWSLATEAWIPWLWMGADDPQAALTQLYVNECARLVRTEYDWWLSKSPKELGEKNPLLRWLSTPTEPNRLAALDFALRRTAARGYNSAVDESAKPVHRAGENDPTKPDETRYVGRPSDPDNSYEWSQSNPGGPKRTGGRPCLSEKEAKRRKKLVEKWQQAKAAGTSQIDFCSDKSVGVEYLNKCVNWIAQRNRRSNGS